MTRTIALCLSLVTAAAAPACKKAEKNPPASVTASAQAATPGTAASAAETAAIGQAAPDFTLRDEDGKEHRLGQYRGRIVVLEWTSPHCPFVKRHYAPEMMPKTAASFESSKVVWLAVDSSHFNTPEATRKWRQEMGFAYPTLQDTDGKVGRLYGAKTTPHMFVIDAQGILRYAGAIDNDPRGKDPNRVNYVTSAVGALFQGKAPSPATTQPYGCTVKYRS